MFGGTRRRGVGPHQGEKLTGISWIPNNGGSCFPINRWLLLFLPRQLDGRRYLLPKCLIKFWRCEAWAIRGKKCHPWDCQGLFPCSPRSSERLSTEKESYCSCWAVALPTMPRGKKRRWVCYCVGDWNFIPLSRTSSRPDFEKQQPPGISLKGEKKNERGSELLRSRREGSQRECSARKSQNLGYQAHEPRNGRVISHKHSSWSSAGLDPSSENNLADFGLFVSVSFYVLERN